MSGGKQTSELRRSGHDCEVRPIAPADESGLLSLWRDAWTSAYGLSLGPEPLNRMLAELDRKRLAAMVPDKGERGYCAVATGQIVGSAVIAERGRVAYIWGLYVGASHQRSGVGSRLLRVALESITTCQLVEVNVMESSLQALAFYRKHGLRPLRQDTVDLMSALRVNTLVLGAEVAHLMSASG